jgi:hypothetical protein
MPSDKLGLGTDQALQEIIAIALRIHSGDKTANCTIMAASG